VDSGLPANCEWGIFEQVLGCEERSNAQVPNSVENLLLGSCELPEVRALIITLRSNLKTFSERIEYLLANKMFDLNSIVVSEGDPEVDEEIQAEK